MYSQEELNVSNKTYINKDFPALYNELLDIAQKISYKYDPTTSNESDPFIVLLKLLALSGDKLNYNVDKNILERFLPSITQWNAMQERTSSLGYNMHYYQSAEGYITMKYKNILNSDDLSNIPNDGKVSFPAFETQFTNSSTNVNYILIEPIIFNKDDLARGSYSDPAPIIQGALKHFTTIDGDESLVTLSDLDENNRLYFPEVMVAQNGIFIEQEGTFKDTWHLVDNLNVQLPKTKCYIFRYDSVKKLPYIQFPEDISSLIDGGLSIKYVITDGENGNVSADNIDTILTNGTTIDFTDTGENLFTSLDNYIVTNPSALTNGTNIENIDETYNSFQKTVGTLDTLVTCRDYANYIYNLSDKDFNSLVSNIQVCDRRDDYNYSTKVVTYNDFGQSTETIVEQQGGVDLVTAFDLMLYPLQPMSAVNYESYLNSFKPLNDIKYIKTNLENSKCLSHNYKELDENDVHLIKNYYQLKAKITTTYKVNQQEQVAIRNNIIYALEENFNARKVNYGEEIPYDSILKVIENADSRIKFVSLDEPYLIPTLCYNNGTEEKLFTTDSSVSNDKIKYLSKNILAGRVSLYDYDTAFAYDYGQTNTNIEEGISTISTCAKITLTDEDYSLQENEVIQVFTPSFINGREWNYGWFYETENLSFDDSEQIIKLENNKKIYIYELATSSSPKVTLSNCYVKVKGISSSDTIKQINSGASITEQTLNKVELTDTYYLYWITNNIHIDNEVEKSFIDWDANDSYTLLDGEYLYVTDSRYSFLTAYGPGTKIVKPEGSSILEEELEIIDVKEIETQGVIYLKGKFIQCDFDKNTNKLILIEQQILTLTNGDKIKTTSGDFDLFIDESNVYSNILSELTVDLEYELSDGTSNVITSDIAGEDVYIRARLDVDCDSTKYQKLYENQFIYIPNAQDTLTEVTEGKNINSKYPINIVGGNNRLIETYSFDNQDYIENDIYYYTPINTTAIPSAITNIASAYGDYYKIPVVEGYSGSVQYVTIDIPIDKENKATSGDPIYYDTLVMIYISPSTEGQSTGGVMNDITVSNGGYNLTTGQNTGSTLREGMNVLSFNYSNIGDNSLIIRFDDNQPATENLFSGNIVVSKPTRLNGKINTSFNPNLGNLTTAEKSSLLTEINSYNNIFYYNYILDKSIDIDDNLTNSSSLFNVNNVVNKITLPEIDIDYAINNILIAKSSQI